jgi:hypothetical protein
MEIPALNGVVTQGCHLAPGPLPEEIYKTDNHILCMDTLSES